MEYLTHIHITKYIVRFADDMIAANGNAIIGTHQYQLGNE